ncbi:MAG: OB-fold domain-containing protein [Spirochaetaceae bacterium]|nr:OB-fold domain-containing protein [Myxococcales bacterium]MCB9723245.1 OB-fold domain-containing protein [Spirochaetaceae bacterium]
METGWILPDLSSEVTRGFWDGCAAGELRIQTCGSCGAMRMPPRPMCPACRSVARDWKTVSGEGRIWSFVVAHPPLLPAYAEIAPYPVVTVALAEDPTIRIVGGLVGGPNLTADGVDPATIEIGDPVRVVFAQIEDVTVPRWTGPKWA